MEDKKVPLIYKKMSDVMRDVSAVSKSQVNLQQNFKFRGIDQFVNALHGPLCKHGVIMVSRKVSYNHEIRDVTRSNGKPGLDKYVFLEMEYDFYAEDGSKLTIGPIPAEAIDSGDKATNKALSAALKYMFIPTFCIPTEDMAEGDSESPEINSKPSPPKPVAKPQSPKTPGDYVVDFGPLKGKALTNCSREAIEKALQWAIDKQAKPQFQEAAIAYLDGEVPLESTASAIMNREDAPWPDDDK